VLEHTYLAMQTYGVSESKLLLFKGVIWVVWNLGGWVRTPLPKTV